MASKNEERSCNQTHGGLIFDLGSRFSLSLSLLLSFFLPFFVRLFHPALPVLPRRSHLS